MENGIYKIPFKEYLKLDRISNSYLSRLSSVPAKAKIPTVETPVMVLGTALHSFVLEPDTFKDNIAVLPVMDRRKKAGKEAYAQFISENEGKTIISAPEFEAINGMRMAVKSHPMASKLLSAGIAEQSVLWKDAEFGLKCKARPDWLTNDGIIVDLKKTRNASKHGFLSSIVQYKYYIQSAFYLTGLSKVSEIEYQRFIFIAVNDQIPYEVACYELSDEFLEYGYFEIQRLMEIELRCREDNYWPGYSSSGITELDKPRYL